jgi:hypothetical protein
LKRPHEADAREHRRTAKLYHKQQAFHCRSPFGRFVLSLRKLRDVIASIFECGELAPAISFEWSIL